MLSFGTAVTPATDQRWEFCWTVHRTSFPWKPILAAYAEPYGSSKTVATTGYAAPVPGDVPNCGAFPGGTAAEWKFGLGFENRIKTLQGKLKYAQRQQRVRCRFVDYVIKQMAGGEEFVGGFLRYLLTEGPSSRRYHILLNQTLVQCM